MNRNWDIDPLIGAGEIKFDLDRSELRSILGGNYSEYKKNKYSDNTTDDYGDFHVYYDKDNKCEAVEFFGNCRVSYLGQNLFDLNKKDFSQLFDDCTEEYGSYVSEKMSIGAYIPEDSVETVLVARKGYYHNA